MCAQGYVAECPNVGKFISNLKFDLSMENEMMDAILKGGDANDRRDRLAEGESGRGDAVARRRHHLRRRRCGRRGQGGARRLSALDRPAAEVIGGSRSESGCPFHFL